MGRTATRSIVADLHLESIRKCRPKTTCGVKIEVRENPNFGFLTLSSGLCMRVDEGIAHMPSNFQRRNSAYGRQHACARRPDHTCPARQNPAEEGQRGPFHGEEAGYWEHCSGGSTRGYWRFEPGEGEDDEDEVKGFRHRPVLRKLLPAARPHQESQCDTSRPSVNVNEFVATQLPHTPRSSIGL